jgi:radical SAM protein with 4Fe4S-binding SPASM domain
MYAAKKAYRAAWDAAYTQDPPIPLNVDLELASVCNLECPFCFIADKKFDEMIRQPSADGKSRRRLMPTELAMRVIDQAADIGVPALKFNWRGESTLHPDYSQIIKYASDQDTDSDLCPCCDGTKPAFHELLVNTNANCPDKSLDGLMAATKVMVSLDSLVPETYAKMRVGGKLERAKEVIKELIQRKHPNLWVRRVITKENREEPFKRMVLDTFGQYPHVSEHHVFDRNEADRHSSDYQHDLKRTYCGYPSQRIVVSSSGLCYPCCIDLHEAMPVGDINRQSLGDIWNGAAMGNLRAELRQDHFRSSACQTCQSWMAYQAPQREFVQDVEVNA